MAESPLQKFLQDHPWPDDMTAGGAPLDFLWEFNLTHAPEKIWPFVADTSRFNRAIGHGKRVHEEVDGRVMVTDSVLGFRQKWIETPWEWVINKEIKLIRIYTAGVAKVCRAWISLEPGPAGGTTLRFYFGWIPRNWFWRKILSIGFFKLRKQFETLTADIDLFIQEQKGNKHDFYLKKEKSIFDERGRQTLSRLETSLKKSGFPPEISDSLMDLIVSGDDLDLQRIRVIPLSREWRCDEKETVKAFLHATELGCMNLSWDVVCPHCRGIRKEAGSLQEIKGKETCDVCQITFDTNTSDAVEVTFRVHPRLRKVEKAMYCSAEPDKKPHIQLQTALHPKTCTQYRFRLPKGVYRLRVLGEEGGLIFDSSEEEKNQGPLRFIFNNKTEFENARPRYNPDLTVYLENNGGAVKTFIVEQFWWYNDALKPGQILCMPEYRHLLSEDHLQNDTILNLGVQTVVFTDMVSSTKFYRDYGDGLAYLKVKKHFDLIFEIFEKYDGYIVKTVGDAVMATFDSPEKALRAAVEVQSRFESNLEDLPIRLRISIHEGSVMAVNLKNGVDYFGSAVNYAAKLQTLVKAAEIVLSEKTFEHIKSVGAELGGQKGRSWRTAKFSLFEGMNDEVHILILDGELKSVKSAG